VVLILCIVVFAGGIGIFYKLFVNVQRTMGDVNSQTVDLLKNAMNAGDSVAIYPTTSVTVPRKKYGQWSLGITNKVGRQKNFTVMVRYKKIPNNDASVDDWPFYAKDKGYVIKNNEQLFVPIRVYVPKEADKGQYVFDVVVCYNETGVVLPIPKPQCTFGGGMLMTFQNYNPSSLENMYSTLEKLYVVVI